jgi:Protein kinase domain/GAF domain
MSDTPGLSSGMFRDPKSSEDPVASLSALWRHGQRPDLEQFVAEVGPLNAAKLTDVLCTDQRQRWLHGERPEVAAYIALHGSLHPGAESAIDFVFGEFLARRELGESPTLGEYFLRFPELAGPLRLHVGLHDTLEGRPSRDDSATGLGENPSTASHAAQTPFIGNERQGRAALRSPEAVAFHSDYESFKRLLQEMVQERSAAMLLPLIVRRLAERPHVALARIWLIRPGDRCSICPARPECPDQTTCLHLVASAGRPLHEEDDWSRLDGRNRRVPLGVRKVGWIAARGQPIEVAALDPCAPWLASPEWVRREGICGFGGQPLIHDGQVVGVLAVFFRTRLIGEVLMWLRLVADHAAAAVASEGGEHNAEIGIQRAASLATAFRFPPAVFPEFPGYEILSVAGRGGMGVVYKARQLRLQRLVAIKVVPIGLFGEDEVIARFHQERLLLAQLAHPNLVAAYDAGGIAGLPYFVMEFVEGIGLDALVRQQGPLPIAEACEVARQAALGLQHLHEHNLVHRDIKPANLMLTPSGVVKVFDLGLARQLSEPGREQPITTTGQFLGTPDYMAPEQCDNSHMVDVRADIYSLGCTLYHLLSGHPPFAALSSPYQKLRAHMETPVPPLTEQRLDVPEPLTSALVRMLAKDRNERFASPKDVIAAVHPFTPGADLLGFCG